jgi:transcriptional regulator with PAS, ATPase and Fis domain
VYRDEGSFDEARRFYRRAMAIAEKIAPEGDLVLEIRRRVGECLILEGNAGGGLDELSIALTHARRLGDRFEEGVTLRCIAQGMLSVDDLDQSKRYALEAIAVLESIDARHEHAVAQMVAVEVMLEQSELPRSGDPHILLDEAWERALIAQSLLLPLDIDHWTRAVQRLQSRIARRRAEEARYATERDQKKRRGTRARVAEDPDRYNPGELIIGSSRPMRDVMQAVEAFAPHDDPLLLTGETGTGKEVVARRVHQLSSRKDGPFVAVNVTAIPQTMFEREVFGHVRGAFSGANEDQLGLAASADGGTLFLDEIGDLSLENQTKLLRLLQDGSYHALGDPRERRADMRIIAATNADLEQAVAEGRFREDLFYRLAILTIPLPPLRGRGEDIVALLDHFLSLAAGRRVTAGHYFNELSLKLLRDYHWPGNVRELAVLARRAHISLTMHGHVEVEVGSGADAMVVTGLKSAAAAAGESSKPSAPALSKARIRLALEDAGGNRSEAARKLGIARATLYRRMEKLGLD